MSFLKGVQKNKEHTSIHSLVPRTTLHTIPVRVHLQDRHAGSKTDMLGYTVTQLNLDNCLQILKGYEWRLDSFEITDSIYEMEHSLGRYFRALRNALFGDQKIEHSDLNCDGDSL